MLLSRSHRWLPLRLPLVVLACVLAGPSSVQAGILWYNGNYDLNDGAPNQSNVPVNLGNGTYLAEKTLVYDNFIVPVGQIWSLTNLYSNNQIAYTTAPTTATWEIRRGMSAGSGGTLLYSGDTAATATLLTPADGNNYLSPEYQISATVTGITLTAGTYWMAVAPDSTFIANDIGDQSYIETTSGAGAIGMPKGNDGNSFINNNLASTSTGKLTFAASNLDYSAGVMGTAFAVPEPSSWLLLGVGLTGASWLIRRQSSAVGNPRT